MATIRVDQLSFHYPHSPLIIKGLSCQFETATMTAVLGVNGSGKSTLIRLLNGWLSASSGSVYVAEKNLRDLSVASLARKIAYVPQFQPQLFPVTVFDTVLSGRIPHAGARPSAEDLAIVEKVLLRLQLVPLALRNVQQLSGGERQKVLIARALAQMTAVVLLDEPTSSLDLKHQHEVLGLLRELKEEGLCIILALHDVNMAVRYCSHCLLLKEGRLLAAGEVGILDARLLKELYDVEVEMVEVRGQRVFITGC
jgi:iron complex transport system ATP-binding protein